MLQKEPIILHLSIYAAKVHIFLHICKSIPSNSVYFCIFFVLDFFSDRILSFSVYKRKALYIFHSIYSILYLARTIFPSHFPSA